VPRQTWIAERLRAFGLAVEEYSGWTTRGSADFWPHGALAHWTAGPCGATGRPSLSTVVNGRPDLAGPLANVYLDRAGVCVVVAAGRANHAGSGGWNGLSGNSSALGVEAECCNAGDWTSDQLAVYPAVLGALLAGCGAPVANLCRHCDWTDRKPDTNDLPLDWLQDRAAAAIAAGGIDREDDAMTTAQLDQLLATGVAAGRIATVNALGQFHVFHVDSGGRLVHRWWGGTAWYTEVLAEGLDAGGAVAATPVGSGGMLQVYGSADGGDTIVAVSYNPTAKQWESVRLEGP